jgi:IclR family mhp operon transcriptional activator
MSTPPKSRRKAGARPKLVKSLLKGLSCLALVNRNSGLNVADMARQLQVPKSTAYRILETLCHGGYVIRDPDGLYRATSFVRTLSSGFDEEEWVLKIAHPELVAMGKQIVWGVGLATPSGYYMHVRETTDRTSPLTLERVSAGARLPMDSSTPGHVYIAFLPEKPRKELLAALQREPLRADSPLHRPGSFLTYLAQIRRQGFGIGRTGAQEAVAVVPILLSDWVIGCIGMHFIRRALTDQKVQSEFVPILEAAAARIAQKLVEHGYDFGRSEPERVAPTPPAPRRAAALS